MQGALEDISKAVGNTPIVRLEPGHRRPARRDLRQVRVPEPRRQPQGPPRAQHAPPRRGGRPQARRHDRRGDERQHRRVARAARRAARLQVRLRHARQDEPGEDQPPARVRRARRRLPHRRRARGPAQLLQGGRSASRARRRTASTRTSTTTPPTPRRTTSRAAPRSGSRRAASSTSSAPAWARAARSAAPGKYFARRSPSIKIVGVDPVGSLYYDFVKTGPRHQALLVQGRRHRRGLLPDDDEPRDPRRHRPRRRQGVLPHDARAHAPRGALRRRLGRRGGRGRGEVRARHGASAARRKVGGRPARILVFLADAGHKYVSKIFNDDWMRENGFLEDAPGLGTVRDILAGRDKRPLVTATPERDAARRHRRR